jgi:hypothetical protein
MKLTKEEEKELMFYVIRFGKASAEAMDIFPFIEDFMDERTGINLDTKYREMFTAKGRRKRELEKARSEEWTRYTKRKKSFIVQWNTLASQLYELEGKFGELFNEFVDRQHELNEEFKEKFSKLKGYK